MSKYRIQITDVSGRVLIGMKDFVARPFAAEKKAKAEVYYYRPNWKEKTLTEGLVTLQGPVLVWDDEGDWVASLRERFPNQTIIRVQVSDTYRMLDENDFQINKRDAKHYADLIHELTTQNKLPKMILYRHTSTLSKLSDATISEELHASYYPLFYLVQSLIQQKLQEEVQCIFVNEIHDASTLLFTEALSGFAKTIQIEQPYIHCRLIDIFSVKEKTIDYLLQELNANEMVVRYDKDGKRLVGGYEETQPKKSADVVLKKEGVYLITGGLGGLGLIFARYLAEHYQAKLVLTGRSELKEKQQALIAELEKLGAKVMYVQSDVTRQKDVHHLMKAIKTRFGALNGIIHSAGVIRDAFILKKSGEEIAEVLAPKIYGTVHLDVATQEAALDFFILFSSTAAIFRQYRPK